MLLALAFFLADSVAAAPPTDGDWVITGLESYADQTIVIANNSSAFGNVTVQAAGDLRLDNVTLILPAQSTFLIQGHVEVRDSTLRGGPYHLRVNGSSLFERTTVLNATSGGTVVETTAATFEHVLWDCGGNTGGTIHLRRAVDFRNNTMRQGCLVAYELSPISSDVTIDFAGNTFNDTGSGTQLTIADALHTGHVVFDIHGLSVFGGGWSVLVGATAPNTTVLIHDGAIVNTSLASIRVDSFDGELHLWNLSFANVLRAARVNGLTGGTRVATIDNITVSGSAGGILAGDATWIIRNSTIAGPNPQYEAEANGHILIYDTADNAFASAAPSAGGSIEHFAFLNIPALTWQGGVPILGDAVSFRNGAGITGLTVTPWNWTPSYIVWWGLYAGAPSVDNRDLHPYLVQGARTFACTPAQFFVSVPMPAVTITCTDDVAPSVTVGSPAVPAFLNTANFTVRGSLSEAGSGLALLEWAYDNATFAALATPANGSFNWTLAQTSLPDGPYTFYLRATDRVGNVARAVHGPILVDTTFPTLALVGMPPVINRTTLDVEGDAEPFSNITVRFLSGWNGTTTAGANGAFLIQAPVHEGVNTFSILVVDRAGNSIIEYFALGVDTVVPLLTVLLNGRPGEGIMTALQSLAISGSCEPGSSVRINGTPVAHAGVPFEASVRLSPGLNPLTVECADGAGNVGAWHGYATFDDTPPTLAISPDGVLPSPGGAFLVRSQVVALFGHVSDEGSGLAALAVNGVLYPIAADGTITLSAALGEGRNTLHIIAVDMAGNTAAVALEIWRDTTRPTLSAAWVEGPSPLVEVNGFFITNGAAARLRLDLSEAASVQAAGQTLDLLAGETVLEVALVEGQNRFSIDYNDTAGNRGASLVMAIIRDSQAPTVTVDAPAPNGQLSEPSVKVSGKTEPGATVRVQGMTASVTATGDFLLSVPLAEGTNTITIEAQDAVGNRAITSVTVSFAPTRAPPVAGSGGGFEAAFLAVGFAVGVALVAVARVGRRRPPSGSPSDRTQSGPTRR